MFVLLMFLCFVCPYLSCLVSVFLSFLLSFFLFFFLATGPAWVWNGTEKDGIELGLFDWGNPEEQIKSEYFRTMDSLRMGKEKLGRGRVGWLDVAGTE